MKYATVCSGIGAPEQAWSDMWGPPEFVSEIDRFPSAVLKHHMPDVPNYGDMTNYKEWPDHDIELICGGTPCQSFSVAGLRKGMDDPRGNLTLTYLGIIARYNPRWVIWENVPGVFSSISDGGSDFGRFLSALAELGYSLAYRVLDAQFFGVPQRRRRVFVVGHLGTDWRPPYAVLFEPESMRGNIKKGRKAGQEVARDAGKGIKCPKIANTLLSKANDSFDNSLDTYVMAHGQGNAEICRDGSPSLTCNHEAPIVCNARQDPITVEDGALPIDCKGNTQAVAIHPHAIGRKDEAGPQAKPYRTDDKAYTHDSRGVAQAVAFKVRCGCEGGGKGYLGSEEKAMTISTTHDQHLFHDSIVRRLTPRECERLQGFPDDYTLIPWRGKDASGCPGGPRYKALGNSMAVPVLAHIGRRIQLWEDIHS